MNDKDTIPSVLKALRKKRFIKIVFYLLYENNINTVQVFPKPADNYINILTKNVPINYRLYNISGREILSGSTIKHIDLKGTQTGIYYLKVYSFKESITKKLIVK